MSTNTDDLPSTNIGDPLVSNLRVATFSIAAFDFIQTIPGEIKFYRRQVAQGRMSLVCFLFIVVRYVSVVSLILNGIGFYATSFDIESCSRYRLAAPVTKMFAGFASQGLIFLRTWAISRKSRVVLIILSALCIITLPMMVIGNVYKREPHVKNGSCIAKQNAGTFNSAPMYYGAMAGFDIIACGIATYYLIDLNANAVMSKFTKKVMQHGMVSANWSSTSPLFIPIRPSLRRLALGSISMTCTVRDTDRESNTARLFPTDQLVSQALIAPSTHILIPFPFLSIFDYALLHVPKPSSKAPPVCNIIVLLGTSHVKYVEKLGAFLSVAVTMIMAQRLVLATQSIKVPPPALEHIAITDRMPTLSSDVTSLSPRTAKTGHFHDFAKLTVVDERDETPSQTNSDRTPPPHFVIEIEQPPPSHPRLLDPRTRSHPPSPVGYAL
ncbi:hypothetical protein RHS04_00246 [Rhizoctonia solani]|uniref:Uncharacterized protein n=1 Tax=Rhizoctonia solani TaxID=456999 RepID=A0A8H7LPA5_9AGAM|nr:hypothetical protein RHS04_00246 [Rhizoctonia solani]